MKFFTLRATTDQQKQDQEIQIKLIQVFVVMIFTWGLLLLGFREIFGKENSMADALFGGGFVMAFIIDIPMILRSSWKKIIPKIMFSALIYSFVGLTITKLWN